MHYLLYFVDFLVYFAFCLMLDPPESRQQLLCLFPEREMAEQGEVILSKKLRETLRSLR